MIGILALQGAFAAHREAFGRVEQEAIEVRTAADLGRVTSLVIPGGESTTISNLLLSSGLFGAIDERLSNGMAALGTCAGAILLGVAIADGRPDQVSFGAIDIDTLRNGYGRQLSSFESIVTAADGSDGPWGTFIRAPRITRTGPNVAVLGSHGSDPVWCTNGRVMVTTFHPELGSDPTVHQAFVDMCAKLETNEVSATSRGAS